MAGRSPSEDMRLGPESPFLMAPFCMFLHLKNALMAPFCTFLHLKIALNGAFLHGKISLHSHHSYFFVRK